MLSKWRLIDSGKNQASLNMAIDEALFKTAGKYPVLRFYSWQKRSISLGIFQKVETELNLTECKKRQIDIVRRPTGGGVVFHGDRIDFTYSLVFPSGKKYQNIVDSYRIIHEALITALKSLKIPAEHALQKEKKAEPKVCFVNPTKYDVLVGGKKIAGAAQRRIKNRVLHQGYLCLKDEKLAPLLNNSGFDLRKKFRENSAAVMSIKGNKVNRNRLKAELKKGFQKTFSIDFIDSQLTPDEQDRVRELHNIKYSTRKWNYKR